MTGDRADSTPCFFVASAVTGAIQCYPLDTASGRIEPAASIVAGGDIASIAVSSDGRYLYASDRSGPAVESFAILPSGELRRIGSTRVQSQLVYISLDPDGRTLFGASYRDSTVCAHEIGEDGVVRPAATSALDIGDEALCHAVIDVPGDGLYVSTLGQDALHRVDLDRRNGHRLTEARPPIRLPDGFGPRHLAVTSDGSTLFVLGERSGAIARVPLGSPDRMSVWSSLPDGAALAPGIVRSLDRVNPMADPVTGKPYTWAADLVLSPDEQFLFSTERASSTLSCSSVLEQSLIDEVATVERPRGIAVDSSGRFLLATGELSTTVALYRISPLTGSMTLIDRAPSAVGALWVESATLPRRN